MKCEVNRRSCLVSLVVAICGLGCQPSKHGKNETTDYQGLGGVDSSTMINKQNQQTYSRSECDRLMVELVYSSNYKCSLCEKYSCSVNSLVENFQGDTVVLVQVFCPETNYGMLIGSIDLDLKKRELMDVTFDEENPVRLKFDEKLMDSIVENCIDPSW